VLSATPSIATTASQTITVTANFRKTHSVQELDTAVAAAYANNQKVLVDFYADWCVSCKIMDKEIFAQADIQQQLNGWVLLRADVTENTDEDRALMQRFQVFGPPAVLFFEQGLELSQARIIGETTKEGFSEHLHKNFQ
jgi:thiol:disulfide interchange protein DsbD